MLTKWKARLEEEKELLSVKSSGAVAEVDDAASEVTFQSLMPPRSEASIGAQIEDMVRTTVTEVAPLIESSAGQVPSAEDAPNPSQA